MVKSKPNKTIKRDFEKTKRKVGKQNRPSNETITEVSSKSLSIKQTSSAACDAPRITTLYPGLRHHAASARFSAISSLFDAFSNPNNAPELPSALPKVAVLLTDIDHRVRNTAVHFILHFSNTLSLSISILEVVCAHIRAGLTHPDLSIAASCLSLLDGLVEKGGVIENIAITLLSPVIALTSRAQQDLASLKYLNKTLLFDLLCSLLEMVLTKCAGYSGHFNSLSPFYSESAPIGANQSINQSFFDYSVSNSLCNILLDAIIEFMPWDVGFNEDLEGAISAQSVLIKLIDYVDDDVMMRVENQLLTHFPISSPNSKINTKLLLLFNSKLLYFLCHFFNNNKCHSLFNVLSNSIQSVFISCLIGNINLDLKELDLISKVVFNFNSENSDFFSDLKDSFCLIKSSFTYSINSYLNIFNEFIKVKDFDFISHCLCHFIRFICSIGKQNELLVISFFQTLLNFYFELSRDNKSEFERLSLIFAKKATFLFVVTCGDLKKRRKPFFGPFNSYSIGLKKLILNFVFNSLHFNCFHLLLPSIFKCICHSELDLCQKSKYFSLITFTFDLFSNRILSEMWSLSQSDLTMLVSLVFSSLSGLFEFYSTDNLSNSIKSSKSKDQNLTFNDKVNFSSLHVGNSFVSFLVKLKNHFPIQDILSSLIEKYCPLEKPSSTFFCLSLCKVLDGDSISNFKDFISGTICFNWNILLESTHFDVVSFFLKYPSLIESFIAASGPLIIYSILSQSEFKVLIKSYPFIIKLISLKIPTIEDVVLKSSVSSLVQQFSGSC
ncbi:hypothetical protein P9112_002839 [Eukaryota sp. TZLM1-RC]